MTYEEEIDAILAEPLTWDRVTPDFELLKALGPPLLSIRDHRRFERLVRGALWCIALARTDAIGVPVPAARAMQAAILKLQLDVDALYEDGDRGLRIPPRNGRLRTVCVSPLRRVNVPVDLTGVACYMGVARA